MNNLQKNNLDILIFTYEGQEKIIKVKIEENQLFLYIIYDLKNQNFIPQKANNFFLMKDNEMINIDPMKGLKDNGLKDVDTICVVV